MLMPATTTQLRLAVAAPRPEHPELPMLVQICERDPRTGAERPVYQLPPEEAENMLAFGLLDFIGCKWLMEHDDEEMTREEFWIELSALFERVRTQTPGERE